MVRGGNFEEAKKHGSGVADIHRSWSPRLHNGSLNRVGKNFRSRCSQPCDPRTQLIVVQGIFPNQKRQSTCSRKLGVPEMDTKEGRKEE